MFKSKSIFKSDSESVSNNSSSENSTLENPSQQNVAGADKEPTPGGEAVSEAEGEASRMKVDLSPEEIAKFQALRSKMISASFGEMVTLLMKSPHYRHYSLSDLEWFLIPPLLTNQFLVVEAQLKAPEQTDEQGMGAGGKAEANHAVAGGQAEAQRTVRIPIGMALWAKVSPEVDAKLSQNLEAPIKLRPDEWRSGEINWLVEIIGDQKMMGGLYEKLKKDVFKDQTFKVRTQNDKGERLVREVKPNQGGQVEGSE